MNVPVWPTRPPWPANHDAGTSIYETGPTAPDTWSRQARPPGPVVSTGSTTRGCAGSTGPRCDRALRVIELVEITARGSVQLVDERTRSSDTPAAGPRITIRVRRSTSPLDHPGSLVSTGSTTRRLRGLDRPASPGLDGLDHPRTPTRPPGCAAGSAGL